MGVEDNKRLVARAVAEVLNGGDLAAVDELYAPEIAAAAREWVAPFRTAFPDVRMETVALVGEGDAEAATSGARAPTPGRGWAARPPAGPSATCARCTGSPCAAAASSTGGVWRTTTTAAGSWAGGPHRADGIPPARGRAGYAERGAYMITATPTRQMSAPIRS